MHENIRFLSFLLVASIQLAAGCKLWCRRPMSFEYYCCEDGNPFTDAEAESSSTAISQPIPPTTTKATTPVPHSTTDLYNSCRYFCVYGSEKVYCCDEGKFPLPDDHDPHEGRCPAKKEQVCKKGGIYLHIHSRKIRTITGGRLLSPFGTDASPMTCASDGYCHEHERCCENKCFKKHTCMRAVFDYDGAKQEDSKKKKKKGNKAKF